MNKKVLVPAALAVIAGIVLFGILRKQHQDTVPLTLSGTVETTSVAVSFKVPGRLAQRLVDEGEEVRMGQEIARLEDEELRQEQRARVSEHQAASALLADIQAGSRREEIAQGEAVHARLIAEAERAAQDARRAEELFKREVIPQKDLDAARAARTASSAAVREAAERVRLLRSGPRPDQVNHARAKLEGAQAAATLAETRLSYTRLLSPLAGVVLAKHAEPGEMLAAGAPVVTIGKLDEVWVRAYIPETSLGSVKIGQQVHISSDTWPGKTYQGTISFISPEAEFTPKNIQTQQERVKLVYRIKVSIPNPNRELKPGMPVDVSLRTAHP